MRSVGEFKMSVRKVMRSVDEPMSSVGVVELERICEVLRFVPDSMPTQSEND